MLELTLLTILTILVILTLRHVKPPVLENPLVIQRVGQYHITLAPQLNGAQAFMERIAKEFAIQKPEQGECETQFFSVQDPHLFGDSEKFYLLAVSYLNGMLFFQVIAPQPLLNDHATHLATIRTFAETVLSQQTAATNNDALEWVHQSIQNAAQSLNINVQTITN